MAQTLLTLREADQLLRYPRGRTGKLVRAGRLPAVTLPDGELRISQATIDALIAPGSLATPNHVAAAPQGAVDAR